MSIPKAIFFIPIFMLILALADLPYGYYQFLRLVVTICAAWVAVESYRRERQGVAALFAFFAVAYNPIFKVHMEREVHEVVNIVTAIAFAFAAWSLLARLPDRNTARRD